MITNLYTVDDRGRTWIYLSNELIAPARSAGASYSETGLSTDQVSVRAMCMKNQLIHRMVSASVEVVDTVRVIFHSRFLRPKYEGAL